MVRLAVEMGQDHHLRRESGISAGSSTRERPSADFTKPARSASKGRNRDRDRKPLLARRAGACELRSHWEVSM